MDRKHLLAAMISALCLNTFCDPQASEDGAEEVDEGESSRPGSRGELAELGRSERVGPAEVFMKHLYERHLAGYPGGASDLERRFDEALVSLDCDDDALVQVLDVLDEKIDRGQVDLPETIETHRSPERKVDDAYRERLFSLLPADASISGEDLSAPAPPPLRGSEPALVTLRTIRTDRYANDEGAEIGPDAEEPYLVWGVLYPNPDTKVKYGTSIKLGGMVQHTEKYVNEKVFSGTHPDVIYMFHQLLEADPGSPGMAAIETGASAALATIKASIKDWNAPSATTVTGWKNIWATNIKVHAAQDDRYAVFFERWTYARFLEITSMSNAKWPHECLNTQPFSKCHGDYKGMAVRTRGDQQWTTSLEIAKD